MAIDRAMDLEDHAALVEREPAVLVRSLDGVTFTVGAPVHAAWVARRPRPGGPLVPDDVARLAGRREGLLQGVVVVGGDDQLVARPPGVELEPRGERGNQLVQARGPV